eukprot:UC4_evm1s734
MGMDIGPSGPRWFDADQSGEATNAAQFKGKVSLKSRIGRWSPGKYWDDRSWYEIDSMSIRNFSAVCWFSAKALLENGWATEGIEVPFGLIEAAVGGT